MQRIPSRWKTLVNGLLFILGSAFVLLSQAWGLGGYLGFGIPSGLVQALGFLILGWSILQLLLSAISTSRKEAYEIVQRKELDEPNAKLQEAQARFDEELARLRAQLEEATIGLGGGGYIIIDLPEDKKRPFHDILIGFEEFAESRGYSVSISVDSSIPNKLAFKFILKGNGKTTNEDCGKDLMHYINLINSGSSLDELEKVAGFSSEKKVLILALRNRINFLQNSHDIQRALTGHYEKLLSAITRESIRPMPAQNLYFQTGTGNQAHGYNVLDSPNALVGQGNQSHETQIDQSIHIADSFNELRTQIDAVQALEDVLKSMRQTATPEKLPHLEKAEKCLRRTREELEEEKKPDSKRVLSCLEQAKYAIKAFGLTKEIIEAGQKLEAAFHLSDWLGWIMR